MIKTVDSKHVAQHLAEFLSRAKVLCFGFAAVTTSAGRHPRERIEDVSNTMTWENSGDNAVTFYRAGIEQFSFGGGDPLLVSIISTVICPEEGVTAFHITRNGNLHINHAHLVHEWDNIFSKASK